MNARRRGGLLLPAICLAALVLKLGVLWQLHDHPLLEPTGGLDTSVYVDRALRVAGGDLALGREPYDLAPLYVYFLAAVMAVSGGSLLAARVVQVALGTAAVWLIGDTARRWFGDPAGLLAAALAALTGVFTFSEVVILQSSLDPFLTALDMWVVTRAVQDGRPRWFALAGASFGLHALNRPNVLAYVPVLALGAALIGRRGTGALARATLVVAGAAIAIAPVTLRNALVAHEPVLISAHGGLNAYIGNRAGADGTYRAVPGIAPSSEHQARDARRVAEAATGRTLSAGEVSSYFAGLARQWVLAHPGDAARLFVRKLAYTINAVHLTLNYSFPFYQREASSVLRLLFVGPWLLFPLGLVGLIVCRPDRRPPIDLRRGYATWASFVPVYALAVAVFFVADRYRMPLLVPMLAASGGLLARMSLASERSRTAVIAWIAALAVAAVLVNWDFGLDDSRAEERRALIEALIDRGRDADAESWLRRADSADRAPAIAYYRAALAWHQRGATTLARDALRRIEAGHEDVDPMAAGRLAEALQDRPLAAAWYRRATESPGAPAAAFERLGLMLISGGQVQPATSAFEEAVGRDPTSATARLNLAVAYGRAGRLTDARSSAEQALRIDPAYERARAFLEAVR